MEFIKAANYTRSARRTIDLVVLHTMEAPEKGTTAESVAKYFQRPSTKASAHYNVDDNSIVQCVRDTDVAWAAPGANHNGLHIEHAGFAKQNAAEWADPFSVAMLRRSAGLAADKLRANGLPNAFRTADDLRAGGGRARGWTTHNEVSRAFRKSTHTDPGPGFPFRYYAAYIDEVFNPKEAAMAQVPGAVDAALIPQWKAGDGRPGVWVVKSDGAVFTYPDEAGPNHYKGGMNGKPMQAPISGIVAHSEGGYWLIGQDGGVFAFGAAPAVNPYGAFGGEYRVGAHAMVDAKFDGTTLICLADDGSFYQYQIAP